MKRNVMMRLASFLLVAVLISTSAISGTYAKYVTSAGSSDKARVAYWGFQADNSMDITNLFSYQYSNVQSVDGADVIAPGTDNTSAPAQFAFAWDESTSAYGSPVAVTGPEVSYNFKIEVNAVCDDLIKNNKNIQWKLDNGAWGTWDQLVAAIRALSGAAGGQKIYAPNTLPAAFTAADDVHTISWKWIFTGDETYDHDNDPATADLTQDEYDTYMGNAEVLDDVSIEIIISATQVD